MTRTTGALSSDIRLSEDIESVARAIDVVGVAASDQVFLRCRQLGAEYAR